MEVADVVAHRGDEGPLFPCCGGGGSHQRGDVQDVVDLECCVGGDELSEAEDRPDDGEDLTGPVLDDIPRLEGGEEHAEGVGGRVGVDVEDRSRLIAEGAGALGARCLCEADLSASGVVPLGQAGQVSDEGPQDELGLRCGQPQFLSGGGAEVLGALSTVGAQLHQELRPGVVGVDRIGGSGTDVVQQQLADGDAGEVWELCGQLLPEGRKGPRERRTAAGPGRTASRRTSRAADAPATRRARPRCRSAGAWTGRRP